MSSKYILAHDVGTSENKATLMSVTGELISSASAHYPMHMPRPGWFEQDPNDWWDAICHTSRSVMSSAGIEPSQIAGLVFSTQMLGTLPVDQRGTPLSRCLVWMDTRAQKQARQLTDGRIRIFGYGPTQLYHWLRLSNGAPSLTGKEPLAKMIWFRDTKPGIWHHTHKFLDAKDYLLHRTTGRFVTTYDSGNVTWLMDTRRERLCWSETLLSMLDFPRRLLPELLPCTSVVGGLTSKAANALGLRPETPVIAGAGDVCSMAVGAGAVAPGIPHMYVGTSSWLAAHTNERHLDPMTSIATICSANPNKYLLVAEQETSGACIRWASQTLIRAKGSTTYAHFDALAQQAPPGAKELYFFPWLSGERTPVHEGALRSGFAGMSLDHDLTHMCRAILEGIALNTRWAFTPFSRYIASHTPIRFVGGGATSDFWCQIFADVLQREIQQIAGAQHRGALGAASIAAHALGYLSNFEQCAEHAPIKATYQPRRTQAARYDEQYAHFVDYYKRTRPWYQQLQSGKRRHVLQPFWKKLSTLTKHTLFQRLES